MDEGWRPPVRPGPQPFEQFNEAGQRQLPLPGQVPGGPHAPYPQFQVRLPPLAVHYFTVGNFPPVSPVCTDREDITKVDTRVEIMEDITRIASQDLIFLILIHGG